MSTNELGDYEWVGSDGVADVPRFPRELSPMQQMLEAIFDRTPVPMACLDRDFRFVCVNRSYAATVGKTPSDFPGVNYFSLYSDAELAALFRRALDTGGPCCSERPVAIRTSGERDASQWDWTVTPLDDPPGVVTHLLLTLRDATERVRAVAAHRETQTMLQTVIDAMPLQVYWKDRDGRYRGCNARLAADAGMASTADVIGKCDPELAWPWTTASDAADDRDVMSSCTGRSTVDHQVTTLDGRRIWLRRSKTPLFSADGEVVGLLGFYDDVTQRKQVDRRLQLTQAAIDKSKSAIYWISPRGQVLYVNDHACQELGYGREELMGQDVWKFDPDFPREAWPEFWEEFKRKGVMTFETRHRRKDGVVFPVEITCNHIVFDGEEQGGLTFVQNITERKRAERDLQLTHVAINTSNTCFYWLSPQGQVIYVNDAACTSLGYTRDELIGLYIWDFDPDFTPEAQARAWEAIKTHGSFTVESRHRRKDGTIFPIEAYANHILFEDEEYSFVFVQDITERKRAERDLKLAHTAINKSKTCFYWLSSQGQVIDVNDYAAASLGYTRDELIGLYIWDFDPDFPPEAQGPAWEALKKHGSTIIESRHRRKDGSTFPIEATTNYIAFNDEEYTFTFVKDISERKATEEQIRSLAFFDPLTRLPNRRLLMDRLKQVLATSARSATYGAVLFIDLDDFKSLNDTKGHDVGDLLLLEVAERLRSTVRVEDTVARLGGDEFVMMLPALSDDRERAESLATTVANRVLEALHRPCLLRGHEHNTSCSIGISLFLGQPGQIEDLLSRADTAMYEAKKAGRNTFRFFDPVMQEALETRARIESWMRQALPKQQFKLYYQLQMDDALRPLGVEALIRWPHPEQGLIPPAAFIPLAEETGLILQIGQWVAETAVAQIQAWEANPLTRGLTVSVNVSARQFRQPDFVDQIKSALDRYRIDPTRLKLELTESLVLHNVDDTIAKMHQIKALGVGFSMDDFGTGHSSLSYLKRLPLDQLKIDQSFVRDIATDPNDAALIQTIISMGHNLGLQVIAEGVETEEQLYRLRLYGCQAFQGYFFGRPQSSADLERRLGGPSGD